MSVNNIPPPGFYLQDCMDAMKYFPDKFFSLGIVDPPYGINVANHELGKIVGGGYRPFGGKEKHSVWGKHKSISASKPYHTFDDSRPPDEGYFKELERVCKHRIIWGGNFMLDYLGKASCMIVWDKGRRGLDQADCEIAWTDIPEQSRVFNWKWNGMLQENMKEKEERCHPCQKPIALYQYLLQKYAKQGDIILDTHVGSGSSLIACERLGFKYYGYEIDPIYYEKAKQRLDREKAQVNMMELLHPDEPEAEQMRWD